ncbi:MAG: DNA replication and repair protein RecF, partial [Kangiellaceae bacterium]|nr:DNA replication and repair protein RecF [Kangiellaceae bacterium]
MYLHSFSYQGFRNLAPGQIQLSPQLSIFIGDNGAGKSSILEAISLITSGRSFRTNKLNLLTNNELNEFTLFGVSSEGTRIGLNHQNKEKRNRIKIDGQNIKSLSSLAKIYPTQVLCPESYHLIDSGPSERRKYLDWCLFHVEHSYFSVWKQYSEVLKQRNALLKSKNSEAIKSQIGVWDSQLVDSSSRLNHFRESILTKLLEVFNELLVQLGVEFCKDLTIKY